MGIKGEIFVVPFFGQGHLFPCMELCKQISARNYKTTLVITSNLSSSVPSALRDNPLVEIAEFPDAPSAPPPPPEQVGGPEGEFGPRPDPFMHRHRKMGRDIEAFLSARPSSLTRPVCAVIDVMMNGYRESFAKFDIPAVSFSTSGAVSAAMECATWQANIADMKPGEIRNLPGLPDDMAVTYLDTKRRPRGPPRPPASESEDSRGAYGGDPSGPGGPDGSPPGPRGPGGRKFGPPVPGGQPPWWDEVDGSIALLINACSDLERPFLEYVENKIGKPVWGVGPLLPEQYWNSVGMVLRDHEIRPKRKSNHTEEEVIQWLNSKPRGSVIYVSFGSEVSPTLEEYSQLADALAESNHPFIWVIQPGSGKPGPPRSMLSLKKPDSDEDQEEEEGYYPFGLENKVGDRGKIIRGWAPQLMILSHPSTGGFLSHCGWNSTMEATGRQVPFLAWPIRGDQFYNAKLLTCHLRVGYMVTEDDLSAGVKKEDIVKGIEKLMNDDEVHQRMAILGSKFENGFPLSSSAAMDAFGDFILRKSEA